jgi:hypothetical protein
MEREDACFEGGVARAGGFDEQQVLVVAGDLALPAVDRADRAEDVDAGGERFADQRLGDALAVGTRRDGDQDNQGVGHSAAPSCAPISAR